MWAQTLLDESTADTLSESPSASLQELTPRCETDAEEDEEEEEADELAGCGHDDASGNYVTSAGEVLDGRYVVECLLGRGSFGQVVKARDTVCCKLVAVKIIKNKELFRQQAREEQALLEKISRADGGCEHVVRFLGSFTHRKHVCLVFELLAQSLYDLLSQTQFKGVSLCLVRCFAQQLLEGLAFLARPDVDVVHCDLKPENVLLCTAQAARIKIIDFGSATPPGAGQGLYKYIQSRYYRAPEAILGLPYTHSIDMWSAGCMLVEMVTGSPLFEGRSDLDQLVRIAAVLGTPPQSMLEHRTKYPDAFVRTDSGLQFAPHLINGSSSRSGGKSSSEPRSLRSIVCGSDAPPKLSPATGRPMLLSDAERFHDLVARMLVYKPHKRITPAQALEHPFVTGALDWPTTPVAAPQLLLQRAPAD